MLPVVDLALQVLKQVHPIDELEPMQRKGAKVWLPQYHLLSFSTPLRVNSPSIKKLFKIQFRYLDDIHKKERTHVVHFGTQSDYVFSKDRKLRLKKLTKMKNMDNPFRGNFWSSWIMNKAQTMEDGFAELQNMVMANNLTRNDKIPHIEKVKIKAKNGPLQLKPLE